MWLGTVATSPSRANILDWRISAMDTIPPHDFFQQELPLFGDGEEEKQPTSPNTSLQQVCQECQQPKPIHGRGLCGACYSRHWRQTHPEQSRALSRKHHHLRKEENNERSRRNYQKNRGQRLAAQREYDAKRIDEKRAYSRQYQREHREELSAYQCDYQPKWRQRNPEKPAEYTQTWRKRHPEKRAAYVQKYMAENNEAIRARHRSWAKNNPDKRRAHEARRRALEQGANINDFTAAQWKELKELYQHCCAYCGKQGERLTQDHVIPLSKGGNHTLSNIVPACKSCNSRKRDNIWTPNPPPGRESDMEEAS